MIITHWQHHLVSHCDWNKVCMALLHLSLLALMEIKFFLCVSCIRDGTIVGLVVSRFSFLVVMEMIFIRPNYACLV